MSPRHRLLATLLLAATPASAIELWKELTKTQKMLDADRNFVEAVRKIHKDAPQPGQSVDVEGRVLGGQYAISKVFSRFAA